MRILCSMCLEVKVSDKDWNSYVRKMLSNVQRVEWGIYLALVAPLSR